MFDEQGVDAPMDDVARRAGVGNATLYRHVPTRRDLVVAVYADEVAGLTSLGDDLLRDADPVGAVFIWLEALVAVARRRDLAHAIDGDRTSLFNQWHAAMHETADALVDAARPHLHEHVSGADLITLANGIALAGTGEPAHLLRLLRHGVET